jgi:glycosyltransferase involved in cell wall biosynthesis
MTLRLAHLASYPMHYHAALYREIASRPEVDFIAYFYSDASIRGYFDPEFSRPVRWDVPLLDGYRSRFLPSAATTPILGTYGARPNWDIVRELTSRPYDAIWIHGYAHLNAWLVAALAQYTGTRILIREDQTLLHPRPWYKAAVKDTALRALFSLVYGLYTGEENRRYFRRYGLSDGRLFPARHCVDNEFFRARATELEHARGELRAQFGIEPEIPVILTVAKLVPKKAPLVLLEAFSLVRERRPCALLLVGEGELRPAFEEAVRARLIPNVHLAGFLNQSELPAAYACADVFCLPSVLHETWGLVVNEALNFDLPVVVTDKVGSASDLVEHERSGMIVPAGDPRALADALETFVVDESRRKRFGRRGRDIVARYSVHACADGIVAAATA